MNQLLDSLSVSKNWQFPIGVAVIVVGTVIAIVFARLILYVVAQQLTSRTKTDIDDKLLKAIRRPAYTLVYLLGFGYLFEYFEASELPYLNENLFKIADGIVFSSAVLIITHLVVRVLSTLVLWFGQNLASRTETKVDDEFVPLVDRGVKVVLYLLGVLVILDHFEVNITGLITVLGVGSLAIALAAQETLANMIGGFVIMIDRPFRTGDRLQLDDGKVCDVFQIGVRSTKFRTRENTLIIVPNAELVKSTIHNLSYPEPETRIRVDVGVAYKEDIEHVKVVMLDEAAKHTNIINQPVPQFRFLNFGESSLDVSLLCRVADVETQYRTESELRQQILKRFRAEGIEIPFPQRVFTMISNPDSELKQDEKNPANMRSSHTFDSHDSENIDDGA